MKVHANAPLGPKGRETMVCRVVEQGWSHAAGRRAAGVSERPAESGSLAIWPKAGAGSWIAPRRRTRSLIARREELVELIAMLRRLRMTGAEIAFCLTMALSTVSAVLLRVGLGKLSAWSRPSRQTATNAATPAS